MQFTALNCEGCGGNLDFAVGVSSAECPYCGQTMLISDPHPRTINFDAMIPIELGRQQFEHKTLEFLAAGELTPDDLLISFRVKVDLHAVYVPFHRHMVTFGGTMTGEIGREETRYVRVKRGDEIIDEERIEIVWEPFHRNFEGRRTVDICLAQSIEEEFLEKLPSATEKQGLSKFSPELIGSHAVEHEIEKMPPDELFKTRGYPRLENHIWDSTMGSAQKHQRNMKVSWSYQLEETTPFLSGVWLQTYEYDGSAFKVVMDASSGEVFGYRPQDDKRRQWLAEITKLGHRSWIPGIISGILLMEGGGLFFLVVIVGVGYYFSFSLKKRIQANSQRFRQGLLEAIKTAGRIANMSTLRNQAETEYLAIRKRQELLPKLYKGSVTLALVFFGISIAARFFG